MSHSLIHIQYMRALEADRSRTAAAARKRRWLRRPA